MQTICIILIILFILSMLFKRSKFVSLLLFILMFLLMAFNYWNADYDMYAKLFIKYGSIDYYYNTEYLFQAFCKLIYSYKENYHSFLFIYSAIAIFLMYVTIKKQAKYPAFVTMLYLIFSFFLDAVQIRHFMASAIICFGLKYLLKNNCTKKDYMKYLLLNIIAIGFHYMAVFYLIFLLIPKLSKKSLKPLLMKIILFSSILFLIINSNIFIKLLSLFLPESKINAYFISGDWKVNKIVTIILIIVQLIPLIILWINKKNNDDNDLLKKVIIMNILLIIVTPFYFYTVEFGRIFRGIIIYDYIALSNSLTKKLTYRNIKIYFMSFLLASILFIVLIIIVGVFNKTVLSILQNNLLFR